MEFNMEQKMWEIDSDLQVGNIVSDDDTIYFNENYDLMVEEMERNYNHWKNHTKKINIK